MQQPTCSFLILARPLQMLIYGGKRSPDTNRASIVSVGALQETGISAVKSTEADETKLRDAININLSLRRRSGIAGEDMVNRGSRALPRQANHQGETGGKEV